MSDEALERVRQICMGLPEVEERLSHGTPTWFVRGKKTFVTFTDNHHNDGRLAIWLAAPPGSQAALVGDDPERFFVPPYVGHRGWVGARLDRELDWDRIAEIIAVAYRVVAPKKLLEMMA